MSDRRWTIDVYEHGARREVMLRTEHYDVTLEIDRDGDLRIEHEVDSDSYGCGSRTVSCCIPMPQVVEWMRAAGYEVRGPGAARESAETEGEP